MRYALILLALAAAACVPVQLSPECQGIIDACLKECRDTGPPPLPDGTYGVDNDQRTLCEQSCHDLCRD